MNPKPVARRFARRRCTALLLALSAAGLVACGGSGGGQAAADCPEGGDYACRTGESEPLYPLQWALNYARSFFASHADAGAFGGGLDLNVEPVHREGIKGQGVNVLVVDTGVDLEHEDLRANADYGMSWNFARQAKDPSPLLTADRDAHGTNVAGMIAAAQNGKGVMGLAPLARVGGATLILQEEDVQSAENYLDSYGGAAWSSKAHVINASFGSGLFPERYDYGDHPQLLGLHVMKSLRGGKGIVLVKAAGNSFDHGFMGDQVIDCGPLTGAFDCSNPADDSSALEPTAIVTAALNAKGQASSYSSAGSVVWITGMGGEYASLGRYGEVSGLSGGQAASGRTGDGPTIFSTDIRGCSEGYSRSDGDPARVNAFMRGLTSLVAGVRDNANCDYSNMNGTSSATPTITGVVALMLSANPELSWRDVRDILRLSARVVDRGYEKRARSDNRGHGLPPYDTLLDLKTNTFTTYAGGSAHISTGSTQVPLELGWTGNAAGHLHSNWYGFGVPDAAKAVELARLYKKEPSRGKSAVQAIPRFSTVAELQGFEYQKVSLLGEFEGPDQVVDQFQVRLSAENVCLGSVGIAVESPAGTKSLLKMPIDHFARLNISAFSKYGAGSYAFYGENGKGKWKIYALASNPRLDRESWGSDASCDALPQDGAFARHAELLVEARLIAQ